MTSDLDTAGYARGAKEQIAADKALIDSQRQVAAGMAATDAAAAKAITGVSRLSKAWIDGYKEASQFEAAVRQVGHALDRGMDSGRATTMVENISRKFGSLASSQGLAKQGDVGLAPIIDQVNRKLEAQAAIAERAARAQRGAVSAQSFQSDINSRLGVRSDFGGAERAADITAYGAALDALEDKYNPVNAAVRAYRAEIAAAGDAMRLGVIDAKAYQTAVFDIQQHTNASGRGTGPSVDPARLIGASLGGSGSAKASAAAFEEAARETERMIQAAKLLRLEIDPMGAAIDRLNDEMALYKAMLTSGVIGQTEFSAASQNANLRFAKQEEVLRRTGAGVRLNRHEMANLSYQINDLAVMTASGQSPFIMIMQQGMQISQLFTGMSLKEGFKSMASGLAGFLTPMNLFVIGLAAAAAGAAYLYSKFNEGSEKIKKDIETLQKSLQDLGESYKSVGRDIASLSPQSQIVVEVLAKFNLDTARSDLQTRLTALSAEIAPRDVAGGKGAKHALNREYLPFRDIIKDISLASRTGVGDVEKFREQIANISNGTTDERLKKAAQQLFGVTTELDLLQRTSDQVSLSLDPLASKLASLYSNPKRMLGEERGAADLYSYVSDNRPQSTKFAESYSELEKNAVGTADGVRIMGEANQVAARFQSQLNAEIEKSAQIHRLDMQAIEAKSPVEKANLAAQRVRIEALHTSKEATLADIEAQQAYDIALRQATKAIEDQARQRVLAAEEAVGSTELQISLIGKTASEVARLTADWQTYIEMRREAEQNGLAFDTAQYERLQKIHAAQANLIKLQNQRKFEDDFNFERKMAALPSGEADIARKLKGAGIEEGSEAWTRYAAALREVQIESRSVFSGLNKGFNESLTQINDFASAASALVTNAFKGMEDAFVSFVSTGKVDFQSFIRQIIADLARLSYRKTMSGLFGQLGFGDAATASSGIGASAPVLLSGRGPSVSGGASGLQDLLRSVFQPAAPQLLTSTPVPGIVPPFKSSERMAQPRGATEMISGQTFSGVPANDNKLYSNPPLPVFKVPKPSGPSAANLADQASELFREFNGGGVPLVPMGVKVAGAGKGWTDIINSDGLIHRRTGARNWRNHNPGNIEYGNFAKANGAIGTDSRFAVFPSYEMGRNAKEALLFNSKGYRGKTIESAISRYAPQFENNTASYTAQVAAAAGAPSGTLLSALNAKQRRSMLDAMERVEGFKVGKDAVIGKSNLNPIKTGMQASQAALQQQAAAMADTSLKFTGDFTKSLTAVTAGAQTAGAGFGGSLGSALSSIVEQIGGPAGSVLSPLLGTLFSGFAGGGEINGPGTGTSDSRMIRASRGEYMVNAESTRRFKPALDAINFGRVLPRAANSNQSSGSANSAAQGAVIMNVNQNISTPDPHAFRRTEGQRMFQQQAVMMRQNRRNG